MLAEKLIAFVAQTSSLGLYVKTIDHLTVGGPLPSAVDAPIVSSAGIIETFTVAPTFLLGLSVVFVVLALIGLVLQVRYHIIERDRIVTTLAVILMLVTAPFLARAVYQKTSLTSKAASDAVPNHVVIEQTSATEVQIKWDTVKETIGAIRYSQSPFMIAASTVLISLSGQPAKTHEVHLTHLSRQTNYMFEILSAGTWYNDLGQPVEFTLK